MRYVSACHSLKVGFKKFENKVKDRACKYFKKINERNERKPAHPKDLTKDEKQKYVESLFFFGKERR